MGQKKLLALDNNFLFDLAGEEDFAEDFKEFFQHLGFQLHIAPMVVSELAMACEDSSE